jgi:hypothetical protein
LCDKRMERCCSVYRKSDKHHLESYINARTCQSPDAIVGPMSHMCRHRSESE